MAAEFYDEDWRDNPTYNDEPLADADLFAESPARDRPTDARLVPPGQHQRSKPTVASEV